MKKAQRIRVSEAAAADILEQAEWYAYRENDDLSRRWEKEVHSAIDSILSHPLSEALCHFKSAALTGIRRMPIHKFPSIWFSIKFRATKFIS